MRYVLLDRITALEPPARAVGIKCVSLAEDVFNDHFPGQPIMPGALILESMAQLGGVLVEAGIHQRGRPELYAMLVMVERAKFRRVVRPGDRLLMEATCSALSDAGGSVRVAAHANEDLAAEGVLGFAFHALTRPELVAQRKAQLAVWLGEGLG
jgi:3-hydroxymyristoyl/3-hydroxydecanoyl-(acyl carrier protein) dehydratase